MTRDMGEGEVMGTRIDVKCPHEWKLHKCKRTKKHVKSTYKCEICGKRRVDKDAVEE